MHMLSIVSCVHTSCLCEHAARRYHSGNTYSRFGTTISQGVPVGSEVAIVSYPQQHFSRQIQSFKAVNRDSWRLLDKQSVMLKFGVKLLIPCQ